MRVLTAFVAAFFIFYADLLVGQAINGAMFPFLWQLPTPLDLLIVGFFGAAEIAAVAGEVWGLYTLAFSD